MNLNAIEFKAAASQLRKAVESFRLWADTEKSSLARSGEWETGYEEWPEITRRYSDLLNVSRPEELNTDISHELLYLLARDNEAEVLKGELIMRPSHFLVLAEIAILSDEADARWQVADALGAVEAPDDRVVPILEQFVGDQNEYVSRRALMALARRKSSSIEPWAVRAWETGHQYQRMAALDALAKKESPLLMAYLDKAQADGREHLVRFAKELRDSGAES